MSDFEIPMCIRLFNWLNIELHDNQRAGNPLIGTLFSRPRQNLITGQWTALAHVWGTGLCIIEVTITRRITDV